MQKKIQIIIIVLAILTLLGIQLLVPAFTGDVELTIPQRIRSSFSWLLGEPEEEPEEMEEQTVAFAEYGLDLDPNKLYELEGEEEEGLLQVLGPENTVELPDDREMTPLEPVEGENQLPIDPVFERSESTPDQSETTQ